MPSLIALMLLALPIAEIAMFIVVGSHIGVLATIALIFASSAAGAVLLRWQGLGAMQRMRIAIERREEPGREVADGMMIALAGLLLITPGFITGALGLLLFIPPVRRIVWNAIGLRFSTVVVRPSGARRGSVIDLDADEYRRNEPRDPRDIIGPPR